MSDFVQRIRDLPQQRLVLLAAQLQERLEQATAAAAPVREPIAVVGVGCRFPGGADDPERFWELLVDGRDVITEVPADRFDVDRFYDADWRGEGTMATRWGGFLDQVDRFDARLFGISPREAATMDPQQRLLLEVTHQALERAGIAPSSLQGTRTGVFCGLSSTDFLQVQIRRGLDSIDGYMASGAAPSVASGRIAYALGLAGPAITVDTACSSSLVAVHLAVQALRRGECDAALAAGVNVLLSPVTTIALSKSQMMAADGRCKTFSAQADGFVRGEGCGVLVLKRLPDAQRDGDRIVGVVRGSATNQDGRSNGLTAPNGPAQEAVIADALADAGVGPGDIGYLEAHGTGTKLGDPIEIQAAAAALGPRSRDLLVGSVKTNIGHLESAAGVAGLIKALLVLEHGTIPPHLHMDERSPVIPWDDLDLDVPVAPTPWPAEAPRLASVSSFGFSGTNAHVVLEAAPPVTQVAGAVREIELVPFSAQSEPALAELLAVHAAHAAAGATPLAQIAATLALGRDQMAHRAAVVAASTAELAAVLGDTDRSRSVARGHVTSSRPPRPVWLFTGQGAQHAGMGRDLHAAEPVFAEVLDRADAFMRARFGVALLDVMMGADDAALRRTEHAQPALFALQAALSALWRSWGIEPAAVAGHSVGEIAAAHAAGVVDLEGGLTLTAERGRLMQALPAGGRMVAIRVAADVVDPLLAAHERAVSIAAINGPNDIVLSGASAAVAAVVAAVEQQHGPSSPRELDVSHAFHSPLMAPVLDEFTAIVSRVPMRDPEIPFVTMVSGEQADPGLLTAPDHWRRHVSEPVRFATSLSTLAGLGHRIFLEIGPHPVLTPMAVRVLDDPSHRWLHSLRKGSDDRREIATALGGLWVEGVDVDWPAWHGPAGRSRRALLPTYPMQRERHWVFDGPAWDERSEAEPADVIGGLVYDVVWKPSAAAQDGDSGLGEPEAAERAMSAVAAELADANDVGAYDRFLPRLEELSAAHIVTGFRRAGLLAEVGERLTPGTIAARFGLDAPHRLRLVRRMLDMLTEDGWVASDGAAWTVRRVDRPDPGALSAAIRADFPAFTAELDLLDRCGEALDGILSGRIDALQVLFPDGSMDQMETIYRDMPMARTFNELVSRAVAALLDARPSDRPLRILEVGGGSGATTESILRAVAGRVIDYTFTDVSPVFTRRARERFAEHDGFHVATFDASRHPGHQGLAIGGFDLVVAANVVHATPDIVETLTNVRALLAPGGRLVLLEATTRERFSDLTVGFTPGWWSFRDEALRPDYPLLDRDTWPAALRAAGFASPVVGPAIASDDALRREAVLVAANAVEATNPADSDVDVQHWLVLGTGPLADSVRAGLAGRGDQVDRTPPAVASSLTGIVVTVEPAAGEDTWTDDHRLRAAARRNAEQVLDAVRDAIDAGAPLWIVTQGTQPAGEASSAAVTDPDGAAAWGLGHVVDLEHPELQCRRVDVDGSAAALAGLLDEMREPEPAERQLAWRGPTRHVRRLAAATLDPVSPVRLAADASYVVSGGLRGIGLLVAEWAVAHGARHLLVFSRSAPDDHAAAAIARWRADGVEVALEQADVGVDADVARVLGAASRMAPIRGVMHVAGQLSDATIANQSWDRFAVTYGPKVFGTASLARRLDLAALDFLVLFGSGAGVGGSAGQANHAAANAYLDALAHRLVARGVNACAIDWGAWTGVGAAAAAGIDHMPGAFSPEAGLAVLERVVAGLATRAARRRISAQIVVHGADWSDVADRSADSGAMALYRDVLAGDVRRERPAEGTDATPDGRSAPLLRDIVTGLPERRRRLVVRDEVRRLAARVLDVGDPEQIEVGQPLHDMGLDSLMAVELRNLLRTATGATLPATLLYDHPSVTALVDHLLDEHLRGDDGERAASEQIVTTAAPADVDAVAEALRARLERLGGGTR